MPEEGSRVHIYFPGHEEQGAMEVYALRMGKSAGGGNQGSGTGSSGGFVSVPASGSDYGSF